MNIFANFNANLKGGEYITGNTVKDFITRHPEQFHKILRSYKILFKSINKKMYNKVYCKG